MEYNVSNADRLGECTRAAGLFWIWGLWLEKYPGFPSLRQKMLWFKKH